MAKIVKRKGNWYSRVRWRDKDGIERERQIPLRTSTKATAHKRNHTVEGYQDDIRDGMAFEFPWLKNGGRTTIKDRTIGETLEKYYAVRNIEGLRKSTLDRVEVAMKSLFTFISPRTRLESVSEDVIEKYKRHCREALNNKPNTINLNLSKIRGFLNWCHRKQYIKEIPNIYMVSVERKEVDYFSDDAMKRIMECSIIDDYYKRSFLFYMDTGCRLFEPFNGYIKGNILVIPPDKAKSHRKRTVPLSPITLVILTEMLDKLKIRIGRRRFAIKNYSRVFKRAIRTVGLPDRYHFHNLRDTYAVRRWAVTGDIHLVSKEIGHKSVTTTEKYADFNLESLLLDFPSLREWIEPRLKKPTIDESFLKALNPSILPLRDTILRDTKVDPFS